jgi:2-methylisocitrate lyase-like PEP mutase family enzyme
LVRDRIDVPACWTYAFLDAAFAAIGTTSFGVAASGGHAGGGRSTKDATLTLARLLAVLPCYISVVIEDGYDDDPERVAEYVAGLDVAGINIEDSSSEAL